MEEEEFRVIPGYEDYCISRNGIVKFFENEEIIKTYPWEGYGFINLRGQENRMLSVHRAVALAWVENLNPSANIIVNHLDGNPANNWFENLEWTTYSGNNYHAVNNGLRSDNIPCKVRDFHTKDIHDFSSMAQAAEFMGLPKWAPLRRTCPKMFGKLIADRYEFRFADDQTPWFYAERTELIPPSRYMVIVKEADGTTKEIYSTKALLKAYQLYDCPNRTIPSLAEYGNKIHPDKEFSVRDSYVEVEHFKKRNTLSVRMPVRAHCATEAIDFESLTQCAKHFNVDRSSITNRLDNGNKLGRWTFITLPLYSEMSKEISFN